MRWEIFVIYDDGFILDGVGRVSVVVVERFQRHVA